MLPIKEAIDSIVKRHWPFYLLRAVILANGVLVPFLAILFVDRTWALHTPTTISCMAATAILTMISAPLHVMLFERSRKYESNRIRQYLEDALNISIYPALFVIAHFGMPTEQYSNCLLKLQIFFFGWSSLSMAWEYYNDSLVAAEMKENQVASQYMTQQLI